VAAAGGPVLHLWPAKWSQKVSQIISVSKFERLRAVSEPWTYIFQGGLYNPPIPTKG
jgi:hypothetical protein